MNRQFFTVTAIAAALAASACATSDTPMTSAEMEIPPIPSSGMEQADLALTDMSNSESMARMAKAKKPAAEKTAKADPYAMIVADASRPAEDVKRDASRKPAATLAFTGVKPGMTVYEMEAGGGYFTQLLSLAVGDTGKVYMQNPAAFDAFFDGAPMPARMMDGGLSNVEYVKTQFDDLQVENASADIVTWFQGPHELYYTPEGAPDGLGDPAKSFAEIARILKPGGALVVIDHSAMPDAPASTGGDIHRIDPKIIIGLAESVGLRMTGSGTLLSNPDDALTTNVFDPSIRGKTDQFMVKFVKPAPKPAQ